MPPKTIKRRSSPKKKPSGRVRRAGTTPRRSVASSAEEGLFAKAFRSSPHPIGITELESGRCLEVNDACLEIFGFRRDEVIGQTTLMLGIWPDPQERLRFIDRLKAEGKVRNVEVAMRVKDGELRRFIISTDLVTLGGKRCLLTIGNDITERKKAEDALRKSEQRFHAIYDQTYEFIGLLTPDGTLIDVNQTALAFRRLQRSDVIGKPFWETPWWDISEELRAKLRTAIAEAATGTFVRLQAQHRAQDGSIEEIDFSLTPITDRTGRVTEIIPEGRRITPLTNALDQLRDAQAGLERQVLERTVALTQLTEQLKAEIAERKQVQEVLRARSAELQITLDTAATGLVLNSRDLRYRWVNVAYATLVGRPVEDLVGRLLSDVLGAEGLAKIRPYIDRVLSGERVEFEAELPIAGGGFRYLHVVYMPDRDAAGDVIGWVGSITDITERKRVETALDTVRNRQHLLLTATPVVLYACRVTGNYGATFISENVREQLGYSPEDFTTDAGFWVEHLHPDDRPWVLAESPRVFEQGHHVHEYRFCHQDGTYRWIHDEVRLIRDPAGVPVELVGFQIDVTQRKRVEEELRQNHAQLEDLTAKLFQAQDNERRRLAHDLHDDITQRLAALTNDLGNLRLKGSTVGDLDPLYNRAKQLTTDVQRLSHQLYPSILDHLGLEEAVRDHVEEFSARTGLATEVVVRHLPPTIPLTQATCLYRILQESLQNVSKHANATTVLIRLVKTPEGIGLCVHDDGRGFDPPQETRKPRGLGLTSMAERVEALKGTFRIKAKPGDGTEVHASVPLEEVKRET